MNEIKTLIENFHNTQELEKNHNKETIRLRENKYNSVAELGKWLNDNGYKGTFYLDGCNGYSGNDDNTVYVITIGPSATKTNDC